MTKPRRHRSSSLWLLALTVVVTDAAVWFVGISFGLIGTIVAVAVTIGTQRKADGYWRDHNAATSDPAA